MSPQAWLASWLAANPNRALIVAYVPKERLYLCRVGDEILQRVAEGYGDTPERAVEAAGVAVASYYGWSLAPRLAVEATW